MQGQTCVICSALFQEFGHNAEPVKRGRCCNLCNDAVVIPERIRLMRLQDETVRKVQRDREPSSFSLKLATTGNIRHFLRTVEGTFVLAGKALFRGVS
jgi:hypothetical protein